MPSKKKLTTINSGPTTEKTALPHLDSNPPPLPTQPQWHDYLRQKARAAVRVVLEEVMLQEIADFLGAAPHQKTQQRLGRRNGYYQRDLKTANGTIPDLNVPRDREGQFHTDVFDR